MTTTQETAALIEGSKGLRNAAKNIELARSHGVAEYLAGWEHNTVRAAATALTQLQARVDALEAENARLRKSVAEEWSTYMNEAVSKAPEPIRQLGEYLAGLLDEDHWKTAERYLNAAALNGDTSHE